MPLSNAERQKRWRDRQREPIQPIMREQPEPKCFIVDLSPKTPLQQAIIEADNYAAVLRGVTTLGDQKKYLKIVQRKLKLALQLSGVTSG
jgi:hypothetical protein